jgi:hypothetical protein
MTKSLRWCCMAWMLLLAPLAARADGPTWTVVPPVAYPEPTKDAHDQSIDTYRMTVLANGGTFDADRYWLRFDGRTPLLACATPQPPSKGPLDLTQCVVRLELTNGKTQAVFSQLPADLGGAQKFVIVPDQTSKPAPAPATTAPPTATSAPQPGTAPPGTPPGGTSTTTPAGTPTTTPVGTSTTAPGGASGGTPAPAAGTVIAPACTSAPPGCEFEVAFALVTPGAVRIYALLVVAALLGIVLLLLNSGQQRTLSTGKGVGLLQAAFLDVETRTYSLSKLQFYIWGFAVISGYIYLTMARSLVQGAFEFASIPDNLPLLMGLSVGTSVASVGVSSLAGNKGAGDVGPLPSDLITSGGVVAPERLLHLLWTIIGGTAFLGFAFSVAPETINNLPSVPNGFLELMGVSAAGYVGGKVARHRRCDLPHGAGASFVEQSGHDGATRDAVPGGQHRGLAEDGDTDQHIDRGGGAEPDLQGGQPLQLHHRQSGRRESGLGVRRHLTAAAAVDVNDATALALGQRNGRKQP